ncbi:GNAT family N-acetyltransferase [Kouleothrix sp.]|uniref:GNAT family N-acetyltransferase n=1 Tax=Kouleothrix sp. TaxID=2779161 RepID=UPI00391B6850
MAKSTVLEVIDRAALGDAELAQVRRLAEASQAAGHGEARLVWDALRVAGDVPNQFLAYQRGRLVGFLNVEGLGDDEAEATGLIDPAATPEPIGGRLVDAARAACRAQGSSTLIVAADQRARPLIDALVALGATRRFAEHKLRRASTGALALPASELEIADAAADDAGAIAEILAADMGIDPAGIAAHIASNMRRPNYHYYIARHAGAAAGTANVQLLNGDAYIYGLVVQPEYRGRGYGRGLIVRTLADLAARGDAPMYIEVETENTPAYTLYRSLGFEHVATFDYYGVALAP